MRLLRPAMVCVFLATLAACDAGSRLAPETLDPAGPRRILSTNPNCPTSGYECQDATPLGGVSPDINVIAANCPEACQNLGNGTGTAVSLTIDADPYLNDAVRVRCPSGESVIMSTHPCWDCRESCAGANCPPGATCVTIHGTANSDCQSYKCEAGWLPYSYAGGQPPLCVRAIDPTVSPAPPTTTASTVNGKVHITWPAVPGAVSYHIYRQIEWMTEPDSWNTVNASPYDDVSTRVSGPPQGYPPAGKWVSYRVVSIAASGAESSYQTIHYYPYTAVIPY